MFRGPLIEIFMLLFSGNRTQSDVVSVVLSTFSVLVILFVVFPMRQCARGGVAKLLGDDSAERAGRLTLNPFAHIDMFGALAMFICRIGWPKPVPVDIRRCNKVKPRTAVILTSLSGPVANILLGYLLIIAYKLVVMNATGDAALYISLGLLSTIQINIYLAVFNLVPIPPFDGFNILAGFLPAKAVYFMERNQQIIYWIFFGLLILGALDLPLGAACNGIIWLLDKASFFVG